MDTLTLIQRIREADQADQAEHVCSADCTPATCEAAHRERVL